MKASLLATFWIPAVLFLTVFDAGSPGAVSYRWVPMMAAGGVLAAVWLSGERRRQLRLPLLFLTVLLFLVGTYALNPTHRWMDGIGLVPADPVALLPGSAHPRRTFEALGVALAAASLFMLGLCVRRKHQPWLYAAILTGGMLMALNVLHQRLSPRPFYEYTATFVNPNHFTAFANLLIPVAWVVAVRMQYRAAWRGHPSSPAGLLYLAVGALGAAVWMTGSRMGVALLTAGLLVQAIVQIRLHRRYLHLTPTCRWWGLGIAVPVGVAALATILFAAVREVARGLPVWHDFRFRGAFVADTLSIWRDQPWWGTGPGTFVSVFPYYQSVTPASLHLMHAHNEPVQFLAEFGVLGVLIAVAALLAAVWAGRRVTNGDNGDGPRYHELEAPGLMIAWATVLLHGWVDFPFRAPSVLLLAALWLSQVCRSRRIDV